jgi:hypothetical protein
LRRVGASQRGTLFWCLSSLCLTKYGVRVCTYFARHARLFSAHTFATDTSTFFSIPLRSTIPDFPRLPSPSFLPLHCRCFTPRVLFTHAHALHPSLDARIQRIPNVCASSRFPVVHSYQSTRANWRARVVVRVVRLYFVFLFGSFCCLFSCLCYFDSPFFKALFFSGLS